MKSLKQKRSETRRVVSIVGTRGNTRRSALICDAADAYKQRCGDWSRMVGQWRTWRNRAVQNRGEISSRGLVPAVRRRDAIRLLVVQHSAGVFLKKVSCGSVSARRVLSISG
jgi:hypothetical protein